MSLFSSDEFANRLIRTLQIIVAALMLGIIGYLGFAVATAEAPPNVDEMTLYFPVGFTVLMLSVRAVVPNLQVKAERRKIANGTWDTQSTNAQAVLPPNATDGDRLLGILQTRTIISCALLEGPAFYVIFTYSQSGRWWLLAVVAGLLALMALQFPTRDNVEAWVKNQLELLELEKSS